MRSAKGRFIILRTIRFGDADLIVHAMGEKGGRRSFFARSALKSRKRFGGGVLEPTHFVEFSYRDRGENSESMPHLEEARLLEGFSGLRSDYARLEMALYFLQLVSRVATEGEGEDPDMFLHLGSGLRGLESATDFLKLKTHFETRLLFLHGVLSTDANYPAALTEPLQRHNSISLSDYDWTQWRGRVHHILGQYAGEIQT